MNPNTKSRNKHSQTDMSKPAAKIDPNPSRDLPEEASTEARDVEIERTRLHALANIEIEDVQNFSIAQVTGAQKSLRHGAEFGFWETPKAWGPRLAKAMLRVNIRGRLVKFLDDTRKRQPGKLPTIDSADAKAAIDEAVLSVSQFLLICRVGPAKMSRGGGRPLDVTTLAQAAYVHLPSLFAQAIFARLTSVRGVHGLASRKEKTLLSFLRTSDIYATTTQLLQQSLREVDRMNRLNALNLWSDKPLWSVEAQAVEGSEKPAPRESKDDSHMPLPDDYVATVGERSLWIIRELGPNVISLLERLNRLWHETDFPAHNAVSLRKRRQVHLAELLSTFEWTGRNGTAIEALPFPIIYPNSRKRKRPKRGPAPSWRPENMSQMMALCAYLQSAHLFVVGLSMGARLSELISLKRGCLERSSTETFAHGLTFKLVEAFEGEPKDWPMPKAAVEAVEQQVRFVESIETLTKMGVSARSKRKPTEPRISDKSDHLWVSVATTGKSDLRQPLRLVGRTLRGYVSALGLSTTPGGQNLRTHRLRKTLARLAGLALTEAPQILMNLFGHHDIETTLFYILSDPDFRADAERVARELKVLRGSEIISAMVAEEDAADERMRTGLEGSVFEDESASTFGGGGAAKFRAAVRADRDRVHRTGADWNADNAIQLAEILTLQGTAFEVVRPGVFCTKYPGTESGPCNFSLGKPETSRCKASCGHRLEEGSNRYEADASIAECLENYQIEAQNSQTLTASFWASQVRAHMGRFSDIAEKWMKNETVASLYKPALKLVAA